MKTPSFFSDPHVQFLSQLLEEISSGFIEVPRFQRPLVWSWTERRELLRSIRDGIPMGAIMVWRTDVSDIDCYRWLGPHKLAAPKASGTRQYILDGVQRLSTLYGALHKPSPQASGEPSTLINFDDISGNEELPFPQDFDVFVDLKAKDFCIREYDQITKDMMPLNVIFNSVALLQFQRSLSGNAVDEYIESSDQIAKAFREYKVPIIPITTNDINLATRTFERINSQGKDMSETHMVHALTWSPDFDLQNRIGEIKADKLSLVGWGNLNVDPILKACKAAFGLDVYKTQAQDLSARLRQNPNLVEVVGDALHGVADFLWNRCGIPSPDLVPYNLQIVVLADAFRIEPNPSLKTLELLHAWFWMTTYGELFAGMSGDQVQLALADMNHMIKTGEATWTWRRPFEERELSKTFDWRAARAKALAFRMAECQNNVANDRSGFDILADAGRRGMVQILPWSKSHRASYSSPANRFLLHPTEVQKFKASLLSGALSDIDMEKHMIPPPAVSFALRGYYDEFVKQRLELISQIEKKFITPLVQQFDPGKYSTFE